MFDKFKAGFNNMLKPKAAPMTDSSRGLFSGLTEGTTPARRGTAELLRAYSESPLLRAVIFKIADAVASVEWEIFVSVNANGSPVRSKKLQRSKYDSRKKRMTVAKRADSLVEVDDHPILDLLDCGNTVMSGHNVKKLMQTYADLKESFTWIERNKAGMPVALWPMPPTWVCDVPSPGEEFYHFNIKGTVSAIPKDDVLWIKDANPADPYGRGVGAAETLADELDTDEYAARFIKAFFYNGGVPDAIIAFDDATEDDLMRVEAQWANKHRGYRKAHNVHFMSKQPDVNLLGHTFQDQQIVELRTFLRDMVNQAFGVPPEIMGIVENSNRATVEAASFIFARWVLVPRLEQMRIAFQQLANQFDERLIVDYVSPVPEDKEFILQAAMANSQTLTRAEWRNLQGQESHGEVDDVYLQPLTEVERPVSDEVGAAPTATELMDGEDPQVERAALVQKAPGLSDTDINTIVSAAETVALSDKVRPTWDKNLTGWVEDQKELLGVEPKFNITNPQAAEHLDTLSLQKMALVNQTTQDTLRRALKEGTVAGESIAQLAKRVDQVFAEADRRRSVLIARTEVLRSSNFGTFQAQVDSGVVTLRQWVATPDGRTRSSHADLDGQIKSISDPFDVGGATANHPGDFDSAGNDINCRCTTVAVTTERSFDKAERKQVWDVFARAVEPWERDATKALREGFAEQRKLVKNTLLALETTQS